jgi:adenylosuccinate synthase
MANLVVVGAQWGDEGKGKVVDLLAPRFQVVARYQGGPNAGHTVTIGAARHALHQIPSGAFHPGVRLVIGNGTVLDLAGLLREAEALRAAGVDLDGRLFVSDRAHAILPVMARLDAVDEGRAAEAARIGTTKRGIGPAYEAKVGRAGIRLADLLDRDLVEERIGIWLEAGAGARLRAAGETGLDPRVLADEARALGERVAPCLADTVTLLNAWLDQGMSALFEGAQGTLLDVDHGSYPFVTSSNTAAGGLCTGLGIAPTRVDGAVGVYKAYATRVGGGPLPTELNDGPDGKGELLRRRGREYGTTTGRPRRCGWFDGVAAAHAHRINRFDAVCVTLLDVLDVFEEIRLCTAYRLDGRECPTLPASMAEAARVEPVWETLAGWCTETSGMRRWDELPAPARAFLERLGEAIGAEVSMVGVGPERAQSIVKPGTWLDDQLRS